MPCPSEQDPVFPSVSLTHQKASRSLLSFSIRGQTEWKPQSQKTNQTDYMDKPCLTQWNCEPCCIELPKMDGSWWRALTKCSPLEKGIANHYLENFLSWESHEQYEKANRYDAERRTPQVRRCPINYWEKSREMVPERMKRQSQSENNAHLWMWLVMEVKSDAVKTILHRNLEC